MPRTALAICLATALVSGMGAIVRAENSTETLQSLVADATAAQARRDFRAAADAYRKATQLAPSIPELWANLGVMDHEIGKSSEAIESFQHAIHLNPKLFVPQLFLGIEYLAAENPAAALPHLETAQKLNPGDLQSALSLGSAFEKLDRADRAVEAFSRATAIAPRNGNAWLDLGTAYLQQVENDARFMTSAYRHSGYVALRAAETLADEGSLNAAENWYKTAIASPSPLPCAHAEYGITLLRLKRVAEAETQFRLEAQTHSHCGLAALGSAVADIALGRASAGFEKLTQMAAADPSFLPFVLPLFEGVLSPDQLHSLVELARQRKIGDEASIDIATLIESAFTAGGAPPAAIFRGESSSPVRKGSTPEKVAQFYATGQYTRCDHALNPGTSSLTAAQERLLVSCSFYAGDFMTAAMAAGRLRSNPATRLEGLYWESKADGKLAIAALACAGEIGPDSPRMHVLIADALRQRRHWSEAEAEYRKAIGLDSNNRAARLSLAIVLFTELKTEEALEIDRSLLGEMPEDAEANLLAGEILVQSHHFEEAEPYLSKCKNLDPDLISRLHILLGQVFAATNRIPEAISEYKLGLASDKDEDGKVHYQLARLYEKSGHKEAAAEEFRQSQQLRKRWDEQAKIDLGQLSGDIGSP